MVSGPMSGYDNYNFALFQEVEDRLRHLGYDVISGRLLFEQEIANGIVRSHKEYLRAALQFMLAFNPDAICLLPEWRQSRGACTEAAVAKSLELMFLDAWGTQIPTPADILIP